MRKIMLAATAVAGLGFAASANAQTTFTPGMAAVDAGTVNVFVKGKVYSAIGGGSDSVATAANGVGAKLNTVSVATMMRLYFGFDGKLKNGLEYGSLVEFRQMYGQQYSFGGTALPVQVRRERLYVGTAAAGRLSFGTTDGPLSNMIVGDYSALGIDTLGGFDGDVSIYSRSSASRLSYPFAGNSPEYMTNKVVYQSPSFAGFDVGFSFEPNSNAGNGSCATAGCTDATTVANGLGAIGTRKNALEAVARYKGSFGPAAVAAEVGTWQGGVVGGTGAVAGGYKALSALDAGATVTVGGLTVGGHYLGGAIGNGDQLIAKAQKNSQFGEVLASYTMGDLVVGGAVLNELSYVSTAATHTMHEIGYQVGGTYTFAPGAAVFVSGVYGTRNSQTAITGTAYHTQIRELALGTVFNF